MRRHKPAKRKTTPFGEADRRDCEGLKRALAKVNEGLHKRHPAWVSHKKLAVFAAQYGGAAHRQQWYDYENGLRRIPEIDKLCATVFFREYRVQDLFPSWRFSQLTPFPAQFAIPSVIHAILVLPLQDKEAFDRLTQLYLNATAEQRTRIVRDAHEELGAPIPK